MTKSIVVLLMLFSTSAFSLPQPWFQMNHHAGNKKDANVPPAQSDNSLTQQITQFLPLVSSLQSAINAIKSPTPSSSNNNPLSAIFPNGVNPVQLLQMAAQVQQLQQAISSASSAVPTTSAIDIGSDLLNLVTLIRSPPTNKSLAGQFQNDLNSLVTKYVPDAQSQANLLSLLQQIKNNTLTPESFKFDKPLPADFLVALHNLVQKYKQ